MYIVYNVTTVIEKRSDSVYPQQDLVELVSMLIGSSHVVTVENHISENGLKSELRVIFWNEDSYNEWANNNRKRYDEIVESFSRINNSGIVKFERYTSLDNYVSDFPYTYYPDKNNLIDWTLIAYHKDFMVRNILPIGKIQDYIGGGEFVSSPNIKGLGSRFIKERTSDIVRRPVSDRATKDGTFPRVLAYSFDQALLTCMYSAPWLYRKLQKLTIDAESLANKYIKDCDNAAVLVGHQSLGDELTLHTHRVTEEIKYTFTIAVRLTFNDLGATYKFYEPLSKDDPELSKYYSDPRLLYEKVKDQQANQFRITERTSLLIFSASMIPHNVEYDDDLYLFYVYDNVNFKDGAFDEIKANSQINYFEDCAEDARMFFFNYQ
jgi:hypothetical protein